MNNIFAPKRVEPIIEQPTEVVAPIVENPQVTVVSPNIVQSGRTADVNIIDLINIKQTYDDGKVVILDNFNMSIPDLVDKGQFIVILGGSGCGKSTLLRYIANITQPTAGTILMRGVPQEKDKHIPMVFQQYSSLPWKTVLENVALPLILAGTPEEEANVKAREMIRLVGLEGHEGKWAKHPILSGGQLQRIAIARNLVANPTMLLMDEPFGALDGKTRNEMQLLLRNIFEGNNGLDPTVILVTHDTREAVFLATDILILNGSPAQVSHHIEIDLPDIRTQATKKDPRYVSYIEQVEDITINFKTKS